MVHPFVRKLRNGAQLLPHSERMLTDLARPAHRFAQRSDIVAEGERQHSLVLITEGWACRYKQLQNGKRQIISLMLPGDLSEPFGALPRFIDSSLGTLTPVVAAFVPLTAIHQSASADAAIEEALWWDLLVATAMEREHIVSIGRRSASERLGHLFCELHLRLSMLGLVQDMSYDMPVTQVDLGDLLGLSTVHVNRSLQELRRTGLVSLRGRRLVIRHLDELRAFSLFDPSYMIPDGLELAVKPLKGVAL